MPSKPDPVTQIPATDAVRDSIASKIGAFDADPEAYQGTVDVVDPAETKEDPDATDED